MTWKLVYFFLRMCGVKHRQGRMRIMWDAVSSERLIHQSAPHLDNKSANTLGSTE